VQIGGLNTKSTALTDLSGHYSVTKPWEVQREGNSSVCAGGDARRATELSSDCRWTSVQIPAQSQIAVAIPTEETGDLACVLLKSKTLENKELYWKTCWVQPTSSFCDGKNRLTKIENLLTSCSYHCIAIEKFPRTDQTSTGNQFLAVTCIPLYRLWMKSK